MDLFTSFFNDIFSHEEKTDLILKKLVNYTYVCHSSRQSTQDNTLSRF